MTSAIAVVALLGAVIVCLGRLLGYTSAAAYLALVALAAPAIVAGWLFATACGNEGDDDADRFLRTVVAIFGVVVASALILGSRGWLSKIGFVAAELVFVAAAVAIRRTTGRLHPTRESPMPPAVVVGLVGALLVFAVAFAATHAPLTLYDSISYHLHFAARWLQDRTISIVPTPFSDEAQAYAPANGELFFLWLMMPFHGDFLSRFGQLPFALAACAALYALARRAGAPPSNAVYPPMFFLLSRQVLEQAVGANVDLVCAAMFVASVYFGIVAVERNGARDWMWFGVAAGLYAGSKYLALVYAPILLLIALMRRPGKASLWVLPGLAAFGLPWYLRNWIVAGSPIYPASLQLAGVTIARGAFSRAAMLQTVFHTRELRLVPVMAAHAFGPTLFVAAIPIAVIGAVRMARRGWWPAGLLVAIPILMAPLYWFGLPINVDSRFFMPAIGFCLLPLAFLCPAKSSRWNVVVHAAYFAAAAWILIGMRAEIPYAAPWYMGGWFALDGLVARPFLPWFAAVALVISLAARAGDRRAGWAVPVVTAVCGASAVILAVGGERWCQPARCDVLQVTSPFIRANYVYAWRWVAEHIHGSTIAYTGINLPYPLTGEQLTNRVVYANLDGHLRWRFDDYDRAYRTGHLLPPTLPLATSSGELIALPPRATPRDDAPRPRYERMQGTRDAWVYDLQRLVVNYVFVAALSAYEIDYVWHNAGGFPIEDDWAHSDPARFRLIYENPQVHFYAISTPQLARACPALRHCL